MPEQNPTEGKQRQKKPQLQKQRAVQKPAATIDPLADSNLPFKEGTVESQSALLKKLPAAQQHSTLQNIGRKQGNQHIQRVIAAAHLSPSAATQAGKSVQAKPLSQAPPQAKMSVSTPGDSQEVEADQVAEQVMRMPALATPPATPNGEENNNQDIKHPTILNRYLQRTPLQRAEKDDIGGNAVSSDVQSRIEGMQQSGRPLPESEREFFEPRMGVDLSGVRVHSGSTAIQTSRELNARAYTVGSHVAFNSGEYQPGTSAGRQLMAHELTHVVQQGSAGALQRTPLQRAERDGVKASEVEEETAATADSLTTEAPDNNEEHSNAAQPAITEPAPDENAPAEEPESNEGAEADTPAEGEDPNSDASPEKEAQKEPDEDKTTKKDAPATDKKGETAKSDEGKAADAPTGEAEQEKGGDASPAEEGNSVAPSAAGAQNSTPEANAAAPQAAEEELIPQTPPDSTAAILKLAEEAKNGGVDIDNLGQNEQSLMPSTSSAGSQVIQRSPDKGGKKPDPVNLKPLQRQATRQRSKLLSRAQKSRRQIMKNARKQQKALKKAVLQERKRLRSYYRQSFKDVRQASKAARKQIKSERKAQIQATDATSKQSISNVRKQVKLQRQQVVKIGQTLAQSAKLQGQVLAQYAKAACAQKAQAARQVGANKASQYSGAKAARNIARTARKMANKLARGIEKSGRKMARAARKDMKSLAKKFRSEARQTSKEIGSVLPQVCSQIRKDRRETVKTIRSSARESLKQTKQAQGKTITKLKDHRQQALDDLSTMQTQLSPKIATAATAACNKVDQDTAKMVAEIDNYVAAVGQKYQGKTGEANQKSVDQALANLQAYQAQSWQHLDKIVQVSEKQLQLQVQQLQQKISTQANKITSQVANSVQQFGTRVDQMAQQVNQKMKSITTTYQKSADKAVRETVSKVQQTITQSNTQWQKELLQGIQQVVRKIDAALAQHDGSIGELGGKIDQKASEIEAEANKSLLEKGLDLFGDIVDGAIGLVVSIVQTLVRVVLTIIVVVIAVLAIIVAIAAAIVLIVGLITLIASIFSGVLAFISALGSFVILLLGTLIAGLIAAVILGLIFVACSALMALVNWDMGYLTGIQSPPGRIPLPEGADYTDWLVNQMQSNAQGPEAEQLRDHNPFSGAYLGWYRLVAKGGIWDFKVDLNAKGVKQVTLGDKDYRFDVLANIHYGYVGRAAGFPGEMLLGGAGVAQIKDNLIDPLRGGETPNWDALGPITHYCDDTADRTAIQVGMELYARFEGQENVTQAQIRAAMIEILEQHDADLPQRGE